MRELPTSEASFSKEDMFLFEQKRIGLRNSNIPLDKLSEKSTGDILATFNIDRHVNNPHSYFQAIAKHITYGITYSKGFNISSYESMSLQDFINGINIKGFNEIFIYQFPENEQPLAYDVNARYGFIGKVGSSYQITKSNIRSSVRVEQKDLDVLFKQWSPFFDHNISEIIIIDSQELPLIAHFQNHLSQILLRKVVNAVKNFS